MDREYLTGTDNLPILHLADDKSAQISPGVFALSPILQGKPVKLRIRDSAVRTRDKGKELTLMLIPLTVYGVPSTKILVSYVTKGSEIVDAASTITARQLFSTGMSWRMAKAISDMLNYVLSLRRE